MPAIRLQLLGTGVVIDPYRVDLLSYNMVVQDTVAMTAIVNVSARDLTSDIPAQGSTQRPNINGTFVIIALTPAQLSEWYALLDSRYGRNDGPQLRPLVV